MIHHSKTLNWKCSSLRFVIENESTYLTVNSWPKFTDYVGMSWWKLFQSLIDVLLNLWTNKAHMNNSS